MPRSPSDHGLDCHAHSPYGYHGNGEEDLRVRRRPIRDGRGRWHSQVSLIKQVGNDSDTVTGDDDVGLHLLDQDHPLDQVLDQREMQRRQEEEFQARYRSDPNLARYPVKPQPSEEAMRMLAQVGRVRHQRRHSDVSLATAEPDHLTPRHAGKTRVSALIHHREQNHQPLSALLRDSVFFFSSQFSVRIGLRVWSDPEVRGRSLWTAQPITSAPHLPAAARYRINTWTRAPPTRRNQPMRVQHRGRGGWERCM